MNIKPERIAQLVSETPRQNYQVLLDFLILRAREAITKRQEEEPDLQGRIDVLTDPRDRMVTVVDNGTGMDSLDVANLAKTLCRGIRFEITTRKPGAPAGSRWTIPGFVVQKNNNASIGSTVKLLLDPEAPWPGTALLNQILVKSAKVIPFPVFFNGKEVISLEAADAGHEFAYHAMPPNRSFTTPVVYRVRERGKPLSYNTTIDD